ncbi:hypothetical protein WS68_23350 [Burkholderia sp. TSV86]|nr:hypothetical protein WS68_23350 [Burkholderia sp. TSV86]
MARERGRQSGAAPGRLPAGGAPRNERRRIADANRATRRLYFFAQRGFYPIRSRAPALRARP